MNVARKKTAYVECLLELLKNSSNNFKLIYYKWLDIQPTTFFKKKKKVDLTIYIIKYYLNIHSSQHFAIYRLKFLHNDPLRFERIWAFKGEEKGSKSLIGHYKDKG